MTITSIEQNISDLARRVAKLEREQVVVEKVLAAWERAAREHPQAGADQIKGDQCSQTKSDGASADVGKASITGPVADRGSLTTERTHGSSASAKDSSPSPNPVATSLRAACGDMATHWPYAMTASPHGMELQSAALAAASEVERLSDRDAEVDALWKRYKAMTADRDAWKKRAEHAEASEATALRTIGLYQDRVIADRADLAEAVGLLREWRHDCWNSHRALPETKTRYLLARLDKRAAQGGE